MKKTIENLFVTVETVKVGEEIQEMKMINGYWLEVVEYKGERKERFKYHDKNSELRKIYEKILHEYLPVKNVMKYIDVETLRMKIGKDISTGKKENMGNMILFIGLEKKEKEPEKGIEKETFGKGRKSENQKEPAMGWYSPGDVTEGVSGLDVASILAPANTDFINNNKVVMAPRRAKGSKQLTENV